MPSGRTWTTSEARRLREMRAAGHRMIDIAKVLGRSENSLYAFNKTVRSPRRGHVPETPPVSASERLRIATLIAIVAFANDNKIDVNTAASRLLMGAGA